MDSKNIFIFILLLGLTLSQLTESEIKYFKDFVLSKQSKKSFLFEDSIFSTKQAIQILSILKQDVPNYQNICKELQSDAIRNITSELININEDLKCKFDFMDVSIEFEDLTLSDFYDKVHIACKLKIKLNWINLYNQLKKYYSTKKFANEQGSRSFSVYSTILGVELMGIIYEKVDSEMQRIIKNELKEILIPLLTIEQDLGNEIIMFNENGISTFKLNSQMIKAITSIKSIHKIANYEDLMNKMLNYFIQFKYEFSSIENIEILLQVYDILKWIPIPTIKLSSFNYVDEKDIPLEFINAFGNSITISNATVEYEAKYVSSKISEDFSTKPKNDYDLEDEPEETDKNKTPVNKKIINVDKQQKITLSVKDFIQNPGEYLLAISIKYKKEKFIQVISKKMISQSTIKIDHLKLSFENTENKADEKETVIEYTKRSYKTNKVTQDSIIKIKVKLIYGDNQTNFVEQLFLRLKHTELGKTFSAYVHKYNAKDGYFYISFALDDPMNMENYNGVYELSLIVSDPSMKNPIIWSFAKIEVSFRKPLDPSMIIPSYKNIQKTRMEPTFTPEQSINKNYLLSIVFSTVIFIICGIMFLFLQKSNANVLNIPKTKVGFIYSLLFVILLLIVFYVMIIFFLKLNILQTLLIMLIISFPGVVIVYKAMRTIKIDI